MDPHVPYQPPSPPIIPGPPQQAYGPPPYYAQPVPPPPPGKRSGAAPVRAQAWKVLTVIAACLLAGLGGLWGLGAIIKATNGDSPNGPAPAARNSDPTYDVSNCTADDYGFYKATVRLTNNRSRAASYVIDIEWVDGSNTRLATDTEYVRSLGPGQSVEQDAIAMGPKGRVGFCRAVVR